MTKSRRRAAWLAVGMLGMSLLWGTQHATAGTIRWREDPGAPEAGDPDGPDETPKAALLQLRVVFVGNRFFILRATQTRVFNKSSRTSRRNTAQK